MADPLSLAASIAGLISLADIAFKHAYKFVRAAKDAKDDILSLTDEINNLASVLRVLEALASDLEAEGDQFDPTLRNHYLNHCFKTLTRIETRLKKAAESFTRSKLESICRQLKWPFSSSETKDLLAELSRHKETINVALAADTMRKLQLSLSKSDELAKKISAVGEIVRRIEINTLIDVNTQKQRVLDYFMKTNPQTNLETSIRLRHSMTGLWLTESPTFTRWLETPSSKLWLTGIPGAGKTVLAGSVIQEALSRSYSTQNIGVAFFFCDYKDPTTWQTVDILGAVISQLARQKDEAFDVLCSYYGHLHPPKRLAQAPDPDELRARINQISEVFDQIIIVVDGLDECGDLADDVVDALIQVADYSERTSMAIFSRDHYDIRVHLEQDFEVIPIAAHTDDVRLYVNAEIDKRIRSRQLQLTSADIREEIQEVLVGRADGIWVVCQIDYLCDCAHDGERREALSKLPPDLPESYRRLLERVNRCSPRVQEVVQMCLHFMTVTEPKLTILELRQAVSAPSAIGESLDEGNTVSEQEITRRCSSLIRNSSDGKYFEFAHFSVREFLEDRSSVFHSVDLERYWISKPTTSYLLAAQCLRFLQMRNFDEMPTDFEDQLVAISERNEEYPFYMHAAVLWIKLTKDGLDDSTLFDLAKSLFKPSKRVHFMYWAIAVLDSLILATGFKYGPGHRHERVRQGWKMVTLPSFRPLHMAAALNLPEICISLIHEGSDVNTRFSVASTLDLALITIVAIPGLADLCSTIPRERNLISSVNDRFLPISKRRNMTIDCLIQAGSQPSSRPIPPNTLSVFSITCLLAAMFNDLSPIIRVLSCHISPSLPEVRVLTSWIETTDSSDHEAELSAREILQYLKSTDSYCSDWGKEVGSIVWDWVIDSKFSLARDLSLANSYISVSEDALVVQLLSAISSDNVDLLRYCLADSRLKDQAAYSGPVHTLLHMAVRNNAFGAFKLLVDEGYNPYTQNDEGDLPIHLCDRRHRPLPFKVFKDLGISFLSRNRNGHNILHLWAQDRLLNYQFVSDLFDLDPEATIDGLQMRTDGHTPLALIFRRAGETPFEELEPDLSKLICSSEDGTALFEELLGRSTSEELVGISPFDHKSSLLHTLATPEDVTSILWLAEALVQRGVDVNQVGSGFGAEPAIDHHLRTASFQFAELLLNQGADISNDASFSNAIHMAILYNNAEFLRTVLSHKGNMSVMFDWVDPVGLIIESADRKISTTGGGILHTASYNNSFDCLKLVFDGSLKLNKALMSDERFTPVHISAYKGFVEVTGLFLANGFDVTAESEFGYTPLHMAVRGRSLPTVKFLLEHGASDSLDAFGKTPRRLAFELEFVEIYNFLEQAAKDSEKLSPFISGTCLSGRHIQRMGTALEKAVREDDYDTIQLLLDSGCPIDIPLPASGSRSALTLSLDMEELEMAEWLLASGASALTADDPDCKEGAIELASTWPDLERILPELVKSYFEEGGDLFCGDEFPFHDAVMNDNDGGLEALIYAAEDEYEYPG
ncbi:hypothetical protein ACHAPJ_007630 [Fusarium lateritium]